MELDRFVRLYQKTTKRILITAIILVVLIVILSNSSGDVIEIGKMPFTKPHSPNFQNTTIFQRKFPASLLVVSPPIERASLLSPIGTITTESPTYNWTVVENASSYLIVVKKNGTEVVTWLWANSIDICSTDTCSV